MERIVTLRAGRADDLLFLADMGFEAAAVSPEVRAMGKAAALAVPAIAKYLDGWGRAGDAAVVAVDDAGRRLGAAWYRLFPAAAPGYGYIASDVPELSIGVAAAARGRGIGRALLEALLETARREGYRALSLSVDRHNPARRLYERVGFRDAGVSPPEETSVTMIASLERQAPGRSGVETPRYTDGTRSGPRPEARPRRSTRMQNAWDRHTSAPIGDGPRSMLPYRSSGDRSALGS